MCSSVTSPRRHTESYCAGRRARAVAAAVPRRGADPAGCLAHLGRRPPADRPPPWRPCRPRSGSSRPGRRTFQQVIVVDASVLANAIGDDEEAGRQARELLRVHRELAAPDLVDVETTAVLRRRWLAGTLSDQRFEQAIEDLDRKSTRLNSQSRQYLVCRLLLE